MLLQGRRKIWKSGGAYNTVVGKIFFPPGWDRFQLFGQKRGGAAKAPPASPLATALC